MIFEVLYPEFGNLYGDTQNIRYLSLCRPDAQVIHTPLGVPPAFTQVPVDLVYLGPMTESAQLRVVAALKPYREALAQRIAQGMSGLFTGNAFEVLGQSISNADQGYEVEGLGLFPLRTEIRLFERYSGNVLGDSDGLEVVGFKSQFSQVFGDNSVNPFLRCREGIGLNPQSRLEGIRQGNFIGTSLLGPILVLNPALTRRLLATLDPTRVPELAFAAAAEAAYAARLEEFHDHRRVTTSH